MVVNISSEKSLVDPAHTPKIARHGKMQKLVSSAYRKKFSRFFLKKITRVVELIISAVININEFFSIKSLVYSPPLVFNNN